MTFREYMVPGLIGIILLFNGKRSSLASVYSRETGLSRRRLTAPLSCWYLMLGSIGLLLAAEANDPARGMLRRIPG